MLTLAPYRQTRKFITRVAAISVTELRLKFLRKITRLGRPTPRINADTRAAPGGTRKIYDGTGRTAMQAFPTAARQWKECRAHRKPKFFVTPGCRKFHISHSAHSAAPAREHGTAPRTVCSARAPIRQNPKDNRATCGDGSGDHHWNGKQDSP